MKKFALLFLLTASLLAQAQPKLVGTLSFSGKKQGGSIFRSNLPGTAPDTLLLFNNLAPHAPTGGVTEGDNDFLYGLLQFNGVDNNGCLYRIKKDGSGFSVLHRLANFPGTSTLPFYHSDGMIYFSDEFELKKYNPSTNNVTGFPLNAGTVQRNLWIDANDWVYLATEINEIAKLKTDGTGWTVLHNLTPATEGSTNITGLTETPGDTLFGVNVYDGANNGGTLYSLKKDGSGFTVHHQFTATTGSNPESKLEYFDGKLYGTTTQGGNFGNGVLYRINADGTGYEVLHHFEVTPGGGAPARNIRISSEGRIFGVFYQFASNGSGNYRMFKVDTSGANYALFYLVVQRDHGHFNKDPLLLNDSIFLTTGAMGRHDGGVLTLTDTISNVAPTELLHFGLSANGFRPNALIKGSDSKLYGTTVFGGAAGNGIIFSVNDNGTGFAKLHELTDAEGYAPSGKLLEASDGRLYGLCSSGGPANSGTLFRMNKNGTGFGVVYTFPNPVSAKEPQGFLVEDAAGVLYGVQRFGSTFFGAVFKINKDGTGYTVLKDFNFGDLSRPVGGLVMSGNALYGLCSDGGAENKGGVFRIRKDGTGYTVLHDFTGLTDGAQPLASALLANGKIYGATSGGGTMGNGTVFRLDTTGANYTILKHLNGTTEGSTPFAPLMQASDGLLYGATGFGGPAGGGAVFKMGLDGSGFALVRNFDISINGQVSPGLLDVQPFVPLPVRLLSFTAAKTENAVALKWSTANEQASDKFIVERSADGNSFVSIGVVAAAGNSSSSVNYQFTDAQPLKGWNHYRLKQTDKDGRFVYSGVVRVDCRNKALFVLLPNPAKDVLQLRLFDKGFSQWRIVDAAGKVVKEEKISATAVRINIESLSKGWYVLQLIGKEAAAQRFLKQ